MDRQARPVTRFILILTVWMQVSCSENHPLPPEGRSAGSEAASDAAASKVGGLPVYELKIDPTTLNALERDAFSEKTYPATFVAEGKPYPVQVRHRGAWARTWPKKPFKIFFNKNEEFQGGDSLNLNSGWRDPAFIREPLAYHVYAACGVPSSQAQPVELHVNGRFCGLYIQVEQPEKSFLKRQHLKGASIYKANSRANMADERDLGGEQSYASHYEKENHKSQSSRELQVFCHELATTTDILGFFEKNVETDKYINYLAATALVQNWDGFNKNHFLLHEEGGKWLVTPWDLDRTFGDHWDGSFTVAELPLLLGTAALPGPTGWNRMADRFLNNKVLRARFLDRLQQLLEQEFTEEKLFPVVNQLESEIAKQAVLDRQRWAGSSANLTTAVADIKKYIKQRRSYLLRETARLRTRASAL